MRHGKEEAIELTANSRLAISTDGITETFGADDEMFSKERLLETLLASQNRSLDETNELARQVVDTYRGAGEQTDDVTLLLMQFNLHDGFNATPSIGLHQIVRSEYHRQNI